MRVLDFHRPEDAKVGAEIDRAKRYIASGPQQSELLEVAANNAPHRRLPP
jgi:hypothetical protein